MNIKKIRIELDCCATYRLCFSVVKAFQCDDIRSSNSFLGKTLRPSLLLFFLYSSVNSLKPAVSSEAAIFKSLF